MSKRVLITGSGGFIGSHLVEACLEEGYRIKCLVRYNSRNNWGWLESLDRRKDIEVVVGDVRDFDSVQAAMRECDTVFHLAALIGIPYSYISPLAYVKTNIEGTYNVLQVARDSGVSDVVITSTSETYGTAQYVPIDEAHPLVGQSPYAASKIAADQLAVSYYRSFSVPVKIVRPFNTYGPRQSARAIIPTMILQLCIGNGIVKTGNINPTRDFTYVKDTARAFIEIAKSDSVTGEVVNIGTNSEISIGDLSKLIGKIMGRKIEIVTEEERIRPGKSEVERLCCDNTKIFKLTEWVPQYSLEQGLRETVKWLQSNRSAYKGSIYNV